MSEPSFKIFRRDDLQTAARDAVAADNAEFHDDLLASERKLTGAQVGEQAALIGADRDVAAQWERAGAIFSVPDRGTAWFLAFQFRDGRPHPTIERVLAALPGHFSPWQKAAWFVSTNGWLDDDAPYERLDEPDLLVAVARHEAEDVIG